MKPFINSLTTHLAILIGWIVASQSVVFAKQPPNILLILVDDVGYADINVFAEHLRGTPIEQHFRETPRIDELAREGMMLTQFYVHSVCTPTRASLLTGKMATAYIGEEKANSAANHRHPKFERPQVLLGEDGIPTHLYAPSGLNVNGGPGTACYLFRIRPE